MKKKLIEPASDQPKYTPRKGLCVESKAEDMDTLGRDYAGMLTSPELAALRVMAGSEPAGYANEIDSPTMLSTLRDQAAAVNRGDLSQAEAMLINQATALQSLFVGLTERAMTQEHFPYRETYMRLALRAQSQCRATIETLSTIKNPPVIYAKQANVTTGPQQINNGASGASGAAAPVQERANEIEQFQQIGGEHELLPDTRASGDASRIDPALEAVGEVDRAKVARG